MPSKKQTKKKQSWVDLADEVSADYKSCEADIDLSRIIAHKEMEIIVSLLGRIAELYI